MTAGIMLVLMSFASAQIIGDNVMESIEVTPRIGNCRDTERIFCFQTSGL